LCAAGVRDCRKQIEEAEVWTSKGRIESDRCASRAHCCAITPQQAEKRGMAWVIGAFLICPCHLPLTVAALATLLAGTAAGPVLQEHPYVAGSAVTAVWLAATLRGVLYFRAAQR
jgi:MerE protein